MDTIESSRTLPAKSLDFWFDFTCPFAYLGSTQARALAERMGVALVYEPLLLGGVFKAVGTAQNLSATRGPARSSHEAADMARWAAKFGVPLRMPEGHPLRSVEALRATLAVGIDPDVVDGFFRAYWVEGRRVSEREVIADVVSRAGHDPDRVLAAIETAAIKDDLRARTAEAVKLGIFGVPTWIVDGTHLYWGQDRIPFVEGVRRDAPAGAAARRAEPADGLTVDAAGVDRSAPATASVTETASVSACVTATAFAAASATASVTPTDASTDGTAIEMYWDFSSPFSYLGATQVEAFAARRSLKVEWHPILLGGLFRSIGTPDVPLAAFSEAKQRYYLTDLHRWAEYWRIPFKFNSHFPMHSLKALRLYLALPEDRRAAFREATYRAVWADDRDIGDERVLADCIGDHALFRDASLRAASDEVKSALRAATERAASRGVFGVPTIVIGGELFWGQDRLELAFEHLRG